MLSLLSSRCSTNSAQMAKSSAFAPPSSSGSVSGSSGLAPTTLRMLLLFYSQIVGDHATLVAGYIAEGNYRAAIGR